MVNPQKAIENSGTYAFTIEFKPDFPIEFFGKDNPFSDNNTALLGDIIHPDDYMPLCEIINDIVNGEETEIKAHARLKTGSYYRWFYISGAPDTDDENENLCGMIFDVSEFFDCECEDAVMKGMRSRSDRSLKFAKTVPPLADILGVDYLERIQQPFSNIKGLNSMIIDNNGKIIAAPSSQDKTLNLNKMSYQRKKKIRIKRQEVACWVIASEKPENIKDTAPLLDTMVQTVSEMANSYLVISEEMENSRSANKLLGQNFEDQILVNNLYSLILQSKSSEMAFENIIPLIREYFDLDEIMFCVESEDSRNVFEWDRNGKTKMFISDYTLSEKLEYELENNTVVCVSEDELKHKKSRNRSCALSKIYENGISKGIVLFIAHGSNRVWTNRDRKVLRNVTQIISTVLCRAFVA